MLPRFALLNNKINNVMDINNETNIDTEEEIITSFTDTNQLKTYIKILATEYYIDNKQFVKSTTDVNKLINGFIQYITNNPQKIADMLALNININKIRVINVFINIVKANINNDNDLLMSCLNKHVNTLQKLNNEIQNKTVQIINTPTKFFDLVYKPGTYGHNKSDYTKFGKQLFNKVKEECDNYIQSNSEIQNALLLICNVKLALDKNFYMPRLLNQVTITVLSYIQNINSSWDKDDIEHFIRTALKLLSSQIAKQFKTNDFSVTINQIIQVIKNNLNTLLSNVQFEKLSNGYYQYSCINTHTNERFDDVNEFVLEYIKNNKDVAEFLVKQVLNIDLNEFQQKYEISWRQFINLLLDQPEVLNRFHLLIKKYIANLNRNIILQKSNEINNIKDDNKIISFDEQDNLVDTEGNIIDDNYNSKDKLILDFDPRNEDQRERPLVVFREYLSDDINDYKDHVKIGRRGEIHPSVINRNKKLMIKSIFPGDDDPTFACAYVIGKICVIDNYYGTFPSLTAVKDAIKQSGKFSKIYIIPGDDPILFRLARKI